MKCNYCNSEIGQNARFCPNCGKAQPYYGKKSSSKLWIWVVVGLFLLFGLLIGSGGILYLYLNNKGFFSHKMTETQIVPDTTADVPIQKVQDAYVQVLEKYIAKGESNNHWEEYYFLHDVTGDGIPELWLQVNDGDSFSLVVFTYKDGSSIQLFKGDLGAPDHISYYRGKNYVIKTYFSMGYVSWQKYEYKNGVIQEEETYSQDIDLEDENAEMKEPSEPIISCYDITDKQGINSLR